MLANFAILVLIVVPVVSFWLAWSWRKSMRAWALASAIAPTYLLLTVVLGLDHFGGWLDVAFVVITLWGIFLAATGAILGRFAVRRRKTVGDT